MDAPPLVSILCTTYNHEPFIADAMEGFLMQEVDFPIEILINDDASTDRTPEILREYEQEHPHLLRITYQTVNQYSQGVKPLLQVLLPRARGKYIALCEGDDYWIDPRKLKTQVAYMEKHPECSMSVHSARILAPGQADPVDPSRPAKERMLFVQDVVPHDGDLMPTAGMLFRRKYVQRLPPWIHQAPIGDLPLMLALSAQGYVWYVPDVMSVYRVGVAESWTNRRRESWSVQQRWLYFRAEMKMYDGFDEWSGGQWAKLVGEKKRSRQRQFVRNGIERVLSGARRFLLARTR